MNTNDEILKLTAELDALRDALEEVCSCERCDGRGKLYGAISGNAMECPYCQGTGRDYHGSEKARKLLEAKP